MRKTAYQQMMWGFLFILFSFRIQGIDFLPDVVGYILFLLALSTLSTENRYFSVGRTLCIPLVVLSIFEIYQAPYSVPGPMLRIDAVSGLASLSVLVKIATWILQLLLVYHVLEGTRQFADQAGHSDVAQLARSRWNIYLAFEIFVVVVTLFTVIPLVILGVVWGLVVLVLMMQLMNQCSHRLA